MHKRRCLRRSVAIPLVCSCPLFEASCRDYYVHDTLTDAEALPANDAGAVDGAVYDSTLEVGPDAGSSPCLAPPPKTLFCDDFDVGLLGSRWDRTNLEHGAFDEAIFLSGPRSYRLALPSTNREVAEYLGKKLAIGDSDNVELDVDMRLDQFAKVYPLGFIFGANHGIVLNLDGYVNEQGGPTNYGGFPIADGALPFNTWRHVTLRVRRGSSFSVELLVNGTVAVPVSKLVNPSDVMTTTSVVALIGLYYAPKDTPWGANFDNFLVQTF